MPIDNTSLAIRSHSVMNIASNISAQGGINKISNLKLIFFKLFSNKLILKISAITLLCTSIIIGSYLLLKRHSNKKVLVYLRNHTSIATKIERRSGGLFFKSDVRQLRVRDMASHLKMRFGETSYHKLGYETNRTGEMHDIYGECMYIFPTVDAKYEEIFKKSGGSEEFKFLVPLNSQVMHGLIDDLRIEALNIGYAPSDPSEAFLRSLCEKKIELLESILRNLPR